MKRSTFLKQSSILSPLLVTFNPLAAIQRNFIRQLTLHSTYTDRVLVLIQLNGGNDCLNTFVPLSNYNVLNDVRKNILIPENKVLKLENTPSFGFHPSLKGLQQLYNNDKLSVIHGVSYPNPDLSHFKGINIKLTANCGLESTKSGWIGRYLDNEYPKYSTSASWQNNSGPPCIRIGEVSPIISQGLDTDLGIGFNNIDDLNFDGPDLSNDPVDNTIAGDIISHIRNFSKQQKMFAPIIQTASEKQRNLSKLYPENGDSQKYTNNNLTEQLKTIARLIGGGLGSRVYVVCQNGYDTHANQVEKADTTQGIHAELLKNLSDAITAFEDDLQLMGKLDKVLGMTFSEFGRRIKSSDSYGTDHGTADSVILFGSKLKHRMLGEAALLSFQSENDENLKMEYDFRALYASVLQGWLGVTEKEIKHIIPPILSNKMDLFL